MRSAKKVSNNNQVEIGHVGKFCPVIRAENGNGYDSSDMRVDKGNDYVTTEMRAVSVGGATKPGLRADMRADNVIPAQRIVKVTERAEME